MPTFSNEMIPNFAGNEQNFIPINVGKIEDGNQFSGELMNQKKDVEIIFLDDVPKNLFCKKCNEILRLPQKLSNCKHLICANCVNGLDYCPECGSTIDHKKLKLDKETQKKIHNLGVKCSYHDNGCKWTGKLNSLESHVYTCEYSDIICPNLCGSIFPKNHEKDHFENECPKKEIICQNCSQKIISKNLKHHLKTCSMLLIDCPNNCGLNSTREIIEKHLLICSKNGEICPFEKFGCNFSGGRENLQKHIKKEPIKHLSFLCDEIIDLKFKITNLQTENQKLQQNFNLIEKNYKNLKNLIGPQFIWKIYNFQQLLNAKNGHETKIFSEQFLTGKFGYKLFLSAEMDYHGKYLSIFLNLTKHDFDDVLSWPFNHEITLTLMDSDPEKNLRHVIKPKEMHANFASFVQPNLEMNPKFGIEKFCDFKILENFIKNDAIFIKCEIDTETMIIL